jgi:dienelactone hydrolase
MRALQQSGTIVCGAGLAALLFGAALAFADDGELARTWQAARVYVPSETPAGSRIIETGEIDEAFDTSSADPAAVILYAHGCSGLNRITDATGRFLAQAGYIVIAPDSFARLEKPASCVPGKHKGGLHRAILGWRQAEIRHAFDQVAAMPALQDLPVVLMGHSQGAITTATIENLPAAARVIEGWTCHAGWPEYRGLAAPPDQPVLALVGENDPWFQRAFLKGDCGAFMEDETASRSIVYRAPNYLNAKHWLSGDSDVQREILDFIERAVSTKGKNNAG